ncbi:MAG: hypothetical protein A3J27_10110 [Candidatus Tectomicrobia bacterium RIFCSPLOWO2_12_FULL_69_37]|nr:MAG: hypothetical protein A3J27_10110 [Candidatus Tectomicrobia bacterium RIFCSPLOWO2_12_FULL_69_37]OGL64249.1 MAG: hypothetical protein A3I72_10470 [Candidatus Tectomicrobia bacterium RIFCSPLOWO2_02_FULL_70_19]
MRGGLARLPAAAALALLAGCAYEVSGRVEVAAPGRLGGVRRIAVARFGYPHDWTGQFRDIYRRAGLAPPAGEKVDNLERTFLVEDALSARGYEALPWPRGEEEPAEPPAAGLRERLAGAGIGAVLLAQGESACGSVERCTARVSLSLWGTEGGALLWRGEARAATLMYQGDEMQAAVEEALAGLPAGEEGR